MAGSVKDLAGAGLHSAIALEYTQENVKVGPYSRLRTRVWLGETKSVKKAYQGALVHFYIRCRGSCAGAAALKRCRGAEDEVRRCQGAE